NSRPRDAESGMTIDRIRSVRHLVARARVHVGKERRNHRTLRGLQIEGRELGKREIESEVSVVIHEQRIKALAEEVDGEAKRRGAAGAVIIRRKHKRVKSWPDSAAGAAWPWYGNIEDKSVAAGVRDGPGEVRFGDERDKNIRTEVGHRERQREGVVYRSNHLRGVVARIGLHDYHGIAVLRLDVRRTGNFIDQRSVRQHASSETAWIRNQNVVGRVLEGRNRAYAVKVVDQGLVHKGFHALQERTVVRGGRV